MAAQSVEIYAEGMLSCSVCAPADMAREDVEEAVNAQGLPATAASDLRWRIADDTHFKCGKVPNGGVVDCHRGHTRHWLLHC